MRDFDEWLSKFRPSISSYDYYIDFEKVVRNVEEIKVELNILNSLIGSKTIEKDFEKIVLKYPETLQCVPLLLAVRGYEIYAQDEDGAFLYNFKKMNYSVEQYKVFMRKTGLFDMIANHLINNIAVSYTHLDVYKRQRQGISSIRCWKSRGFHKSNTKELRTWENSKRLNRQIQI